jgi:hypothetical protein
MKFQVHKYKGFLHDNISDEIVNESAFVSVKSSFHKFWIKTYD